MSERVYSVTQVNNYIKYILSEDSQLRRISIAGEISSYSLSGGHAYFVIKDEDANLSCVQFGAKNFEYKPKIGEKVVVLGKCDYYIKSGKLSFIVSEIKPYGEGDIWKRFLELKEKLKSQGLFDESRKRKLPFLPKRIGVITSEKGAVIRDIVSVVTRRNDCVDIVLYPAKVQGIGAEKELIAGIDFFNGYDVDVVILARGGGSIEDLAPFYTEELALKVAASKKPIISAVGHETDFSLTDFVADLRAPTPSVAGELVVPDKAELIEKLKKRDEVLKNAIENRLSAEISKIRHLTNIVAAKSEGVISLGYLGMRNNLLKVERNISAKIDSEYSAVQSRLTAAHDTVWHNYELKQKQFELMSGLIERLNPLALLRKGYSRLAKDGREFSSCRDIDVGDSVDIIVTDGNLKCCVTDKEFIDRSKGL